MVFLPLSFALMSAVAQQPPAAAPAPTAPAPASLVAAEYAFTDKADKDGTRAAFLANMHPDGLVFIPRPVNAIAYYTTQLEFDTSLQWFPIRVETSAAGDLGYTTGPWTFRTTKTSADALYGWFVSVWERDGAGPWKVRLDVGISTPDPVDLPPETPIARTTAALPPAPAVKPADSGELAAQDKALGEDASKAGPNAVVNAYKTRVDTGVRFYRKGRFPREGVNALVAALDAYPLAFTAVESRVSGSGDLGFTRGTLVRKDPAGPQTSNYVHIWKKVGGQWKLAAEIELPLK